MSDLDPEGVLIEPEERVLATLQRDGTRRWIRPRLSPGRYLTTRRVVAWILMLIFVLVPLLKLNGKPLILLDITRRQFTLFGTTFLPTDNELLLVLGLGIFLTIFLVTALFGRVWCGWACPQTVYMEFLFRPLERLFEGSYTKQQKLDREGGSARRVLKNVVFAAIACFLANTFLAYFVGWNQLITWVTGSPFKHPVAFTVMTLTTVAMVLDFAWFREQTCLVACPYGRLQSVLLDRHSLIVGYDTSRGEPRGKLKKKKKLPTAEDASSRGDCVDCRACVITCPTGIDIREGLQMECINCTQCMDACDAIMDKVGRERGLIRYSSQAELGGESRRIVRPRVVIYSLIVAALGGVLLFGLGSRQSATAKVLRGIGAPYTTLPSGEINNQLRLKIQNLSDAPRTYTAEVVGLKSRQLVAPELPLTIPGGEQRETVIFVHVEGNWFTNGRRQIQIRVKDDVDYSEELSATLLGPR